jgi:hypothetical protein
MVDDLKKGGFTVEVDTSDLDRTSPHRAGSR